MPHGGEPAARPGAVAVPGVVQTADIDQCVERERTIVAQTLHHLEHAGRGHDEREFTELLGRRKIVAEGLLQAGLEGFESGHRMGRERDANGVG